MVKYVSTFQLKSGYDPDESFQVWLDDHVPYIKEVLSPELKGYIIGRVVQNIPPDAGFYGSVQLSFKSIKDFNKAWSRLHKNPPDKFMKRIENVRRVIIEEQDVLT